MEHLSEAPVIFTNIGAALRALLGTSTLAYFGLYVSDEEIFSRVSILNKMFFVTNTK
jgi:hypothetical protein